jgi:hypothetical protein
MVLKKFNRTMRAKKAKATIEAKICKKGESLQKR